MINDANESNSLPGYIFTEFVTDDELSLVLNNHCCQTISGVAVCPSLAIPTDRYRAMHSVSMHCRHFCRLETKAWPSQTLVARNCGDWPATTEYWLGDGTATRAGLQNGMATTCGNSSVMSTSSELLSEKVNILVYKLRESLFTKTIIQ